MIYQRFHKERVPREMGWQRVRSSPDKRGHDRIIVRLKAVLTFNEISYVGMIENISPHGFYMISLPTQQVSFRPGSIHEMKLRITPVKSLILPCKVQWAYKTPPYGLTNSVGMETLNPSSGYREFLSTLI